MTIASIVVTWFTSAFVGAVAGLGSGLIAVPVPAFSLPMRGNILPSSPLLFAIVITMSIQHRRFSRSKSALNMLAGRIPGTIAGVFIFETVPA